MASRKRRRSDDEGELRSAPPALPPLEPAAYDALLERVQRNRRLTPEQLVAVERIARTPPGVSGSVIVKYGVGKGKTLIGVVAALAIVERPEGVAVIVVSPLLFNVWLREFAHAGGAEPVVVRTPPAHAYADVGRIYLVASTMLSRHSLAAIVPATHLLIIDEHTVRDNDTKKAVSLHSCAPRATVLLSASLFHNRLGDLLLAALYMKRRPLCGVLPTDKQSVIDRHMLRAMHSNGAGELFDALCEHTLFAGVGATGPSRMLLVRGPNTEHVITSDAVRRIDELHQRAWQAQAAADFADTLEAAAELRASALRWRKEATALVTSALTDCAYSAGVMAAFEAALDRVADARVVVFAHFLRGREAVRAALERRGYAVAELLATDGDAERQAAIDRTEAGEFSALIIATTIGAHGISLPSIQHAVSFAHIYNPEVLIEQPYGRIRRYGTAAPTTFYLVCAATEPTEHVARIALTKMKVRLAIDRALGARDAEAWQRALEGLRAHLADIQHGGDAADRFRAFIIAEQREHGLADVVIDELRLE